MLKSQQKGGFSVTLAFSVFVILLTRLFLCQDMKRTISLLERGRQGDPSLPSPAVVAIATAPAAAAAAAAASQRTLPAEETVVNRKGK